MPIKEKDTLVLKKETPQDSGGWRPITVSVQNYQIIKELAEESNMPISKVAGMMLEFAIERAVVEK